MIAHSIEAAIKSGCFDRIVVSTDDKEIAEVALNFGAEVPFIRPNNIADDFTPTLDVLEHALIKLGSLDTDNICCLYATAPFVSPEQLLSGLNLLNSDDLDYVFSAAPFVFPIQRAFFITDESRVKMLQPEHFNTRSQDLPEAYHDAGQFYWGKCASFKAKKTFFTERSRPLILPISRVQDIDNPEDWEKAELMYKLLQSS